MQHDPSTLDKTLEACGMQIAVRVGKLAACIEGIADADLTTTYLKIGLSIKGTTRT